MKRVVEKKVYDGPHPFIFGKMFGECAFCNVLRDVYRKNEKNNKNIWMMGFT